MPENNENVNQIEASEHKGVFLYFTQIDAILSLPPQDGMSLLQACTDFFRGKEPRIDNPVVKGVFIAFKPVLSEVDARYMKNLEQRRKAGKAGAEKRWKGKQEDIATASERQRTPTSASECQRPLASDSDRYESQSNEKDLIEAAQNEENAEKAASAQDEIAKIADASDRQHPLASDGNDGKKKEINKNKERDKESSRKGGKGGNPHSSPAPTSEDLRSDYCVLLSDGSEYYVLESMVEEYERQYPDSDIRSYFRSLDFKSHDPNSKSYKRYKRRGITNGISNWIQKAMEFEDKNGGGNRRYAGNGEPSFSEKYAGIERAMIGCL